MVKKVYIFCKFIYSNNCEFNSNIFTESLYLNILRG